MRIARQAKVDAIHPGYGFLSGNPNFAQSIVTVPVQPGQRVSAGSTLVALEAMKMETHIAADRDGEIAAVHVHPGDRVAAKDLLIELKAAAD